MRVQKRVGNGVSENDIEDVHDLRVCTRHLRAILAVIKPKVTKTLHSDFKGRLKCLGKTLGHRRELDVSCKLAKKYNLNTRHLAEYHQNQTKTLYRILESRNIRKLGSELGILKSSIGRIDLKERRKKMILAIRSELMRLSPKPGTQQEIKKTKIHELRIEIKKANYILVACGYSSRPLEHFQKVLGHAHDLEVLRKYLKVNSHVIRDEKKIIRQFLLDCHHGKYWNRVVNEMKF